MNQMNGDGRKPGTGKRSGLTGRAVALAVKRHPVALLVAAVLAAGAAGAVWFFLPVPKTTVATVFHISTQTPVLLDSTVESRIDFGSYRQVQAALVKRRATLNNVTQQPAIQSLDVIRKQGDPTAWLDRSLQVESRGNEFMRVSLEGDNPEELRVILEAVSKAYLADADERDNGVRRRRLAKLEDTNRNYSAEFERFHKRIETIALALGSRDGQTLALMDSLMRDEFRAATRELSVARDMLQWAELDLATAGGNPPAPKPDAPKPDAPKPEPVVPVEPGKGKPGDVVVSAEAIDEELRKDRGYLELDAAVIAEQQTLAETKKLYREGVRSEAVIKAEKAVSDAEQKRDAYRAELRPRIEAAFRKQHDLREQARLITLRAQTESLKKRETAAKNKITDIQNEIRKASDYRVELDGIKALIGQNEKLSTRLTDEIERIKIELGAPSRVTLSEEPYTVTGIEGNRRMKYTLLAAIGVMFLGFAGVVAWEQRSQRLTHPDDVTTALGVRLIGAVPNRALGVGEALHPILVEAIDATRTMLLNGAHESDLRVLVIASAVSGEGKTSLSGHLAISLARAGFRTLLVDGDLRAPTAQRVFGVPLAPGLCEVLQGETTGVAAARPTGVPGLSVLTAGNWTLATRQALVGDGWRNTKEQLKAAFDFVVVDTSPLLLVADALLLAREADGVVVSVLMGVSQVALVEEAVNRLYTVRAKVTGVIANGVRTVAYEYAHHPVASALPAATPDSAAR